MAASIVPFDPLMDLTSLTSQAGLLPLKIEAGTEIGKEAGNAFQESLFAFKGPALENGQVGEKASPLLSLLKSHPPLSKEANSPDEAVETLFSTEEERLSPSTLILNSLIEAPLEDEVSMIALSYAMALQEKENQSLKQNQILRAQLNEGEFSELTATQSATLSIDPEKTPLSQSTQHIIHTEAEINADQKETILPPTVKTAPSTAKQGPIQDVKANSTNSLAAGKEAPSAVAQAHSHSDSDSDLKDGDRDSAQEEGEELNSGNTKNGIASKEGKASNLPHATPSFSEALSKAPSSSGGSSNAQAGLTSLQSGTLESIEGKDIEEAFHRGSASIDTKTTATQSTQPASSQGALAPNANLQEQVAFSIKNNAPKGKSEINLQLRPDSLGRLNIKIDINKEGQTFVVVTAERTETRDLLQKDSQQLMELLEQSDLDISDDNMSYSLFNDQEQQEFKDRQAGSSDITTDQAKEGSIAENTTTPLISLGMREIQIPRHGGTWQAIA